MGDSWWDKLKGLGQVAGRGGRSPAVYDPFGYVNSFTTYARDNGLFGFPQSAHFTQAQLDSFLGTIPALMAEEVSVYDAVQLAITLLHGLADQIAAVPAPADYSGALATIDDTTRKSYDEIAHVDLELDRVGQAHLAPYAPFPLWWVNRWDWESYGVLGSEPFGVLENYDLRGVDTFAARSAVVTGSPSKFAVVSGEGEPFRIEYPKTDGSDSQFVAVWWPDVLAQYAVAAGSTELAGWQKDFARYYKFQVGEGGPFWSVLGFLADGFAAAGFVPESLTVPPVTE